VPAVFEQALGQRQRKLGARRRRGDAVARALRGVADEQQQLHVRAAARAQRQHQSLALVLHRRPHDVRPRRRRARKARAQLQSAGAGPDPQAARVGIHCEQARRENGAFFRHQH